LLLQQSSTNTKSLVIMEHVASHEQAYSLWKSHTGRPTKSTEHAALSALRDSYPDFVVTRANPKLCNLLEYAAHGFATCTPEDGPLSDTTRLYEAPRSRLEENADGMRDDYDFARFSYVWNDTRFIVYQGKYKDLFGHPQSFLFVLHPRGGEESPSHLPHGATDALLMAAGRWTKELHNEILVFDDSEWKKSKDLWRSIEGSSWDDVILDPDMKASLIEDIQGFFDNREAYKAMQVPWKRGVILHGVPGNGKTISVMALISSLATRQHPVPSLYVKSLDACPGPKWSLGQIFQKARAMAPCLLIFEDLDSMVTPKTRSYFLNEVDGLESNEGILMIGSTNYLEMLDPSITERPSRFDRKYHFKLPGKAQREAYCQYWCQKFAGSESVDFPDGICPLVAKITAEFSFAYLKELFISSLLILARDEYAETQNICEEDDSTSDVKGSEDGSTSDRVVVGHEHLSISAEGEPSSEIGNGKPVVMDGMAAEAADTKIVEEETPVNPPNHKRLVPKVDIPSHLRGNALLLIICRQVPILLREMDNSDEAEAKKRAQSQGKPDGDSDCCNPMTAIFQASFRAAKSTS
jgi:AAA+ superfamily predicted ATPase